MVVGINFAVFQYLTGGASYSVSGGRRQCCHVPVLCRRLQPAPLAYPDVLSASFISYLFVSPWMHQIHHSLERRHIDKNMGFIFSFWDWMFGTLYIPARDESFAIGLDSGEAPKFHGVGALYLLPFRNVLARLGAQAAAKSTHKPS